MSQRDPENHGEGAARVTRLTRRADFQRAARGARWRGKAFTLQARRREEGDEALGPRVGFTATRKIGGAVERNRIRRRLKEAMRRAGNLEAKADHDYVLVAQRETLTRRFVALCADLTEAFAAVHAKSSKRSSDREDP
ncbi:MAG TPA: ribonuclease P protein component [Roseiarcus sp.]|nr:ribonuclease P protein component [Roseiarcus sp.]